MCLSGHRRTNPTSKFILLERRNEFGYYEAYKISADFEKTEKYVRYPGKDGDVQALIEVTAIPDISDKADQKFRTEIFGEMPYTDHSKPRYYACMENIEHEKGVVLSRKSGPQEIGLSEHGLWSLEWSEYAEKAKEIERYKLLALVPENEEYKLTRSQSSDIEIREEQELIKVFTDKIRSDYELLESVINKERLSQAEAKEVEKIQSDPYKRDFYRTLRIQLNSIYIACSAVTTGMVENQQTGAAGKIGKGLEVVGKCIPVVGVGVQILGMVLEKSAEKFRKVKVDRYTHLVQDAVEMSKLSEQVARKLALLFSKERRPQVKSTLKEITAEDFTTKFSYPDMS